MQSAISLPLHTTVETDDGFTLHVRYCDGCGERTMCAKQVVMVDGEEVDTYYWCRRDWSGHPHHFDPPAPEFICPHTVMEPTEDGKGYKCFSCGKDTTEEARSILTGWV